MEEMVEDTAKTLRDTKNMLRISHALLQLDPKRRYGFKLMQYTRLPSSSMYPMLHRMELAGLVTSYLEKWDGPKGRPLRRYYELTEDGEDVFHRKVEEERRFYDRTFVERHVA
jgi:DNA-binding PadR family transcriptional regulator